MAKRGTLVVRFVGDLKEFQQSQKKMGTELTATGKKVDAGLTKPFQDANTAIEGTGKTAKMLGGTMSTEMRRVDKAVSGSRQELQQFSSDLQKIKDAKIKPEVDTSEVESGMDKIKGLAIGAGALAGVGLAGSFMESLDIEAANDKLAGQLGLTKKESARIGGIAGDLYANAYGESMQEVDDAVGAVMSSIEGMTTASSKELKTVTAAALNFASAFEVDVQRAAQIAGQVVHEGLAKNATGAFDLLIKASQEVPAAVREDLLDAVDEYGPFFANLGLSGSEAFGLLAESAKKGMYGIDKTGDALKELTLSLQDTAKKPIIAGIGLNFQKMSTMIAEGGEQGRKALDLLIDKLLAIKDPGEQARTAIALFGTPLEDLSVKDIPEFIKGLDISANKLEDFSGSAKQLDKTLAGNAKTNLTEFTRKLQQFATNVLGNQVIPKLEEYGNKVQQNFGPVVSSAATNIQKLPDPMKEFGVALGIAALAAPKLNSGLQTMGTRFGDFTTDLRTAPKRMDALKGSVQSLAGAAGLGLLIHSATQSQNALTDLETIGGGALMGFAAGGGVGAAVGAGAGALLVLARRITGVGESAEEAQPPITDYTNTLKKLTSETTRQTRALVAQRLEQEGVLEIAQKAQIPLKLLVDATLGNQKATNKYTNALIDAADAGRISSSERQHLIEVMAHERGSVRESIDSHEREQEAIRGSVKDIQRYQKTLDMTPKEVATKLLAEGIDQAIGGTEKFRDRVNDIMDSIRDEAVDIKLSASAAKTASKIANVAESFHAEGGKVRGRGTGTSDSVRARLSKGEFVIREKVAKQIYPFLGALNSGQAEAMEAAGARTKKGRIRFAQGGMVMAGTNAMTPVMNTSTAITGIQNYAHAYESSLDAFGDRLGEALSKALNQMLAFGGNGQPLGPNGTLSLGQIMAGQSFAKSQAGKPYVWAGVGPGGYDCSGFQSAVLNSALGQYPYSRRGSTGTMPWSGSRPGVGRYTIGWFTGSPGHTSGNIGGLGVESRGGDGVVVGSGATSPLSSMFNGLMHYDRGGPLKPGLTLAYNGTGRTEQVVKSHPNRSGPIPVVLKAGGREFEAYVEEIARQQVEDEFRYQAGG